MSYDVIKVRLQIDQNTAQSVEGQVRNLVSRLNNQRITLTFNTSAVNNCIAQLERLEQTARRIQNSNITINSNLTQSQQSYRLETERIRAMTEQQRISNQIAVERERTLQTENRAVQALATENRTLTVNRNVTEEINENARHTHEHIRNAGNATNDFVAHLGRGLQHLIQYRIFSELLNKFNEGFQELKSTDDAMVSLKKVTDETDEKYNQFLDSAREKADRLARSVSSVVDQTARWAKLGFNVDEAAILSETSSIYANVGEVDDDTAVSDIVTAMKAFNIEAKDSIQIIDKLNNLGNKYALTSADLGEGLSKSASALKFAGNDINQTLAMITGGTEIVQDASIMGNSLKVLSMRIRGMKGELEELGEEYENVESISKIQTQILNLTHGAVNIFDESGNFRSTYNILEDIAEVWERISQTDQAALLETIAGKQRGNQISALIQSFQSGQAQKALSDAINSSGSALKEQEKWLDSIEAKQQKISIAWANYIAGMSDVEMVKGSLDLLASAIDALDTPIGRLISQIILVNTALALTGRLWNGIRARSIIADTLAVGVAEGSLGTAIGLVTEQLWVQATAWLASPLGMATVAALGIYGIVKAVNHFNISIEESREALSNLKSEYSNIKSELQGLNDELKTTQQRIAELESKDKLTFTEAEELENLRKQSNELKRQNDLLEMQEKIKAKEVNDKFVETMEADAGKIEYASGNTKRKEIRGGYTYEINVTDITEKEYAFNQIEELSKLYAEREKATTEEQIKAIDESIETVSKYIQDKNKAWSEDAEGIEYIKNPQNEDEEKVNEWLDFINDFQDRMAIAIGGTDAKTNAFNRIVDNWEFDEALQGLQDLGKQGKVTAEMLKNPAYSNFIQKLIDIGFISGRTDEDLEQVANAFNGVGASAQDARKELTKYAEAKNGVIAKKLNTESDIRALIALANAAGASADALNRLEIMRQNLLPGASKDAKHRGNYIKRTIEDGTFNWGFTPLKAEDYIDNSGGSSSSGDSSKSSTDKDKPDKADPTDAIINRIASNVEALERQGEIIDNQLDMVDAEKEYDKYVELTNKALDNRLKTIEASKTAQNELSKEAQKIRDKYKGIDIDSFFDTDGDFTEAYNKYYDSFGSKAKQEAFADDMKMIQEFKKAWFEYYDDITEREKEVFKTQKEFAEKLADLRWEKSNNWIDERNRFGDWRLFNDSEVEAWKRVINWLSEEYPDELDKMKEAEENLFEARKDAMEKSLSDIEDYIDARNHYNDWDAFGDNELEAIKRQTKIIEDAYKQRLLSADEYVKRLEEYSQRIYSLAQEQIDKSLSDIDKYIDARNHYNDWGAFGDSEIDAIKRQSKILDKAYKENLMSLEDYTEKSEEYAQKLYSIGQEYINKSLSDIDRYISTRNAYDDWDNWGDSEIEAIKRQIDVIDRAYAKKLLSLEEYTQKTEEYSKKLYSVSKNNIIDTISKLIDAYENEKRLEKEDLNLQVSQYSSLKTLLQSHYDVINAIAEAQHEINKELRASKSMYEYLNEETRKLLFNQEDYNVLNEKLLGIQAEAEILQEEYKDKILNANKETIAEITSQYQMQYETLMKQYDIEKAKLDVAKKRQKLDNVLAERNVRMFIDGEWQWVANTQKVIEAENELADAEIEREQRETSLKQIDSINDLTKAQDDITTQINYLETDLEKVREAWHSMQKLLNGESHEVAEALRQISQVSSPELKKVIEETGGNVVSFSASLGESIDTMSTVINANLDTATSDILDNVVDSVEDITSTVSDSIKDIHDNISDGIDNINKTVTSGLEEYSDAIKTLIDKINGVNIDEDYDEKEDKPNQKYNATATKPNGEKVNVYIDSNGKTQTSLPVGTIVHTNGGDWKITGGTAGNYTSVQVGKTSGSTSSGSSSSSGSSGGKTVQAGSDGNAPAGTKVGDTVKTNGGNFLVVPHGTPGSSYNPASGLSSIKVNADGSRYTSGGLNLIGEEGFEAFIDKNGHLIPINQPTIGNIAAGGIVFNQEQMTNLRSLWDLSNMNMSLPHISTFADNKQDTVIDNSIHINGLTVGEQGNEDWINGLRRYVATHR